MTTKMGANASAMQIAGEWKTKCDRLELEKESLLHRLRDVQVRSLHIWK